MAHGEILFKVNAKNCLLLCCLGLIALGGVTHAEQPKGAEFCSDAVSGVLDASSPRWNRVFETTQGVNLACNLSSEDSTIDQSPYAAYPLRALSLNSLSVVVDPLNTSVFDTTLYLYCGAFDPEQPDKNLIAYSDDTPEGLLSGFAVERGLTLLPETTYWLVVSTYSGVTEPVEGETEPSGDFGAFRLCINGDYTFGEAGSEEGESSNPLVCSIASTFSQPVDASLFATTYNSSWSTLGRVKQHELVTGVNEPITALRWWGLAFNGVGACDPNTLVYTVEFSTRSVSLPGFVLIDFDETPTIVDSGYTLFGYPIYTFELVLPEAVTLPNGEGFVSVFVTNPTGNCTFTWGSSLFGDGQSLAFNYNSLSYSTNPKDLSLCLITEPACPEGEPETTGTLKVQLIDPIQFSVITNATVRLEPDINSIYDAAGQLYVFECLPFGEYVIDIAAEGYLPLATPLSFTDPLQFDTYFLDTPEGEGEGDCKGCSVLSSVFVTVINDSNEKTIGTAKVSLVGTLFEVTNNINGVYVIPELSDGTYTVRAEADGFTPAEAVFSVAAQPILAVTLRLNPVETTEGAEEAEAQGNPFSHSGDENGDGVVSLSELLGIIQLYNAGQFRCAGNGYAPGTTPRNCAPHSADFLPQGGDFVLSLTELLRGIQIYAVRGYYACPEETTEDGYCLGKP